MADSEQKGKIISGEFIRVFEEEARKLEEIDFLGQGTIYPDIIESGTKTAKMVIKLPAKAFGIEPDSKFLCLLDVADLEKRVIIHLGRGAVFIKDMLHYLPPIDVDLN